MKTRKLAVLLIPIFLSSMHLVLTDGHCRSVVQSMRGPDITPIDYFDQGMLVLATDTGLRLLETSNVNCRVLDNSFVPGTFYFVWSRPGSSSSQLPKGTTLAVAHDMRLVKIDDPKDVDLLAASGYETKRLLSTPLPETAIERETPFFGVAKDTIIQEMANRVSWDSIFGFVRRLQGFRTRYASTDSARACATWLRNRFVAYGFDSVYTDSFSATYSRNVVAIKRGMVFPGRIYVVGCGHYDCTSESPTTFAPGANDDGSGTAMVLEAARVLRNYRFEYSIRLIGFSGEEQGLLGSADYALKAYNRRDTIRGVVNGDMFGYTTPNRDTLMVINDTTYRSNLWLANYFAACADTYTTLKKRVWTGRRAQSDHASFSRQGFTAIQERENLNVSNPYYHTTGDTIGGGFNAYTMVYQGIRAAVAAIASLAIPYRTRIAEPVTAPVRRAGIRVKTTMVKGRRLQVELAEPIEGTIRIRVFDIIGCCQHSLNVNLSGCTAAVIELPDRMTPGVYFIRFELPLGAEAVKIVLPDLAR